jgi:murein DD-endopeptidase MepM/ murein hydrolase activator NlpD
MTQKTVKRFARFFLLAGISLLSLIALHFGEKMVNAWDLSNHPDAAFNTRPPEIQVQAPPPQEPALNFEVQSSANSANPESPSPQSQSPARSQSGSQSGSQPQTIALNFTSQPQQVAQVNPQQMATGNWYGASFPVENFQAYTSPFGYRQSATGGYSQEFHYGLDMAAPEGSYIRNWWTGKVVEITDNTNCGTSVVVESGPWTHIYCHMQGHVEDDGDGPYVIDREGGLQIKLGQTVAAGDRIGRVGMTGRTTGPHLHWGLKYDANWVDPALVIRAMYANQQQAAATN